MTRDFNDDWLFQKEGQAEERVHLPHDAMITEPRDASCRNGVNTGFSREENMSIPNIGKLIRNG